MLQACACECMRARARARAGGLMAALPGGGPAEDGSELRSHACGVAKIETRGRVPGVGRIVVVTPPRGTPATSGGYRRRAPTGERGGAAPAAAEDGNVGGTRLAASCDEAPHSRHSLAAAAVAVSRSSACTSLVEHTRNAPNTCPRTRGNSCLRRRKKGAQRGPRRVRDVRMMRRIQLPSQRGARSPCARRWSDVVHTPPALLKHPRLPVTR